MKTYTIEQKEGNTGSIHDLASCKHDREIEFRKGCVFAVVLAAYYGGRGYTTHRSQIAAIAASRKVSKAGYTNVIIDAEGIRYHVVGNQLMTDHGAKA